MSLHTRCQDANKHAHSHPRLQASCKGEILPFCQGAMRPSFSTPVKTKQVSLGWSFKRGIGDSEADGEGLVKGGMDSPDFVKESPFKTIRRTTSPASWKLFESQLETARQDHIHVQQDIQGG